MPEEMVREIERHLRKLVLEIGPRPTGSVNNQNAALYIAEELEKSQLSVEFQSFDCINWEPGGATFFLGGRKVAIKEADYTLPCRLEAAVNCIGSVEQLERSIIKGEIVFLFGNLTEEPLMPKNFPFWNPPEHQRIIRLLEEKAPGAILFLSCSRKAMVPLIEDGDFSIPCAVVPAAELDFLQQNNQSPGRLEIKAFRKKAKGANVIARKAGKTPRIAISAHLDTKPFTPGALDNAVGIASLLTLGKKLGKSRMEKELELVAFNGEDYFSNPGEAIFFERNLSSPEEYMLGINIDGIGFRNGQTGISLFEFSPEDRARLMEIKAGFPGIKEIEPWPQGDHMVFALKGIPAVAMTSAEIFSLLESIIHTTEDKLELVDPKRIVDGVEFLQEALNKW